MEFEKLQKIIAEVMNVSEEEIRPETTFVDDLGADSLDVFQIIMGIEEEFDIEIPSEEAEKIVTVGDAVEQIKKRRKLNSDYREEGMFQTSPLFCNRKFRWNFQLQKN